MVACTAIIGDLSEDRFCTFVAQQVLSKETARISIAFRVRAWSAWAPGLATAEEWQSRRSVPVAEDAAVPDVRFVPAMLRRRLGRLSRMALHVAHELAPAGGVPTVFASRHGELSRTVGLLSDLAIESPLSPAAFSLSVHNTASGVHAIAHEDVTASTSIAAGEETLLWALQEAVGRLASGVAQVLLVFAEEPLPAAYAAYVDETTTPHALAMLLETGSDLTLTAEPAGNGCRDPEPLSLALFAWWSGFVPELVWRGERLIVSGQREC